MKTLNTFCVLICVAYCVAASKEGNSLVKLVEKGDTETLLQQVGHGVLADAADDKGSTALMAAVAKGNMKAAGILLAYRANATTINPNTKQSALTMAFSKSKANMAELLLKYGADPDVPDGSGTTARDLAGRSVQLQKLLARWDEAGAEAFEDAPAAWSRHTAPGHNTPFFHNERTSESQFSVPPSCSWTKMKVDGHALYVNLVTHQTKWTRPRALAWKHLTDPSGDGYWYNYVTEATTADVPAELPADMAAELLYSANTYWHNTASKEVSWEDPAERDWREVQDPEGRTFWYHSETLESTWERPPNLSWRAVPSDQLPGHAYYYNDKTGDSQWEKPVPLAWESAVHIPEPAF